MSIEATIRRDLADWLNDLAHRILHNSMQDAPKGATLLLSTKAGKVQEASPHDLRATVYFDGSVAPYAAYQHEHIELKHTTGGKAKYLEDNHKAEIPGLAPEAALTVGESLSKHFPHG